MVKKNLILFVFLAPLCLWFSISFAAKQSANEKNKKEIMDPQKKGKAAITPLSMVFVKGGCFSMGDIFENGSSDEMPLHEVCLSDFYIGKYEITIGSFREFANSTGYLTEAEQYGKGWELNKEGNNWEEKKGISWKNPGFAQTERDPVVIVSWNDARAYIKWLNKTTGRHFRLPSEAEWEFAARDGGKPIEYAWGNIWPDGNIADDSLQNHFPRRIWPVWEDYSDGYVFTSPVGSFAPNSLGIYDMSGNVWEWCADWYSAAYYDHSPQKNPKGPKNRTHRTRRGGSWFSVPLSVRTSVRDSGTPDERDFYLGFRLARNP